MLWSRLCAHQNSLTTSNVHAGFAVEEKVVTSTAKPYVSPP
jgi:hypothetical protein